ncbi:MAG: hypothetical protein ABS35_21875 [Kaistia sp. SCN 65-12]|nr:MAG: hypothetical protein ABS35_21875 [Kaistia sp. SCN 65-12]
MRRSGDQEIASKFMCMRKCAVRGVADDCVAYNFTCLFGRAHKCFHLCLGIADTTIHSPWPCRIRFSDMHDNEFGIPLRSKFDSAVEGSVPRWSKVGCEHDLARY